MQLPDSSCRYGRILLLIGIDYLSTYVNAIHLAVQSKLMENRQVGFSFSSLYPLQTLLKALFLLMSLFDMSFTLLVAFLASMIGVLRVCKNPQFSQEYFNRVINNNHGQNIFYILIGGMGFTNYLFYSPIVIFFAYNIIEYIKIKHPNNGLNAYGQIIRNNRYWVFQTKTKLEIIFFLFVLITLPFDFGGRIIKLFLMGQFLLIKYKINAEFRGHCTNINKWVEEKLNRFPAIGEKYKQMVGYIHSYASRDIQGQ